MEVDRTRKLIKLLLLSISVLLWLALMGIGAYKLLSYDNTPGEDGNFPSKWPKKTSLIFKEGAYNLVMAVHPKCNCSQASLGELAKLTARFPDTLRAQVVFAVPNNAGPDWTDNKNWTAANDIKRVEVKRDDDGKLAKAFELQTSGATLLYDKVGKLVFSGGITAARGHWGDNAGSQAIADILSKGAAAISSTSTFGCNLFTKK